MKKLFIAFAFIPVHVFCARVDNGCESVEAFYKSGATAYQKFTDRLKRVHPIAKKYLDLLATPKEKRTATYATELTYAAELWSKERNLLYNLASQDRLSHATISKRHFREACAVFGALNKWDRFDEQARAFLAFLKKES